MQNFRLIKNPDESKKVIYKLARAIYAETSATSLRVVEALASMVSNLVKANGISFDDVADDANVFESLRETSVRHQYLSVDAGNRGFEMCVRVVGTMINGNLPDMCNGATRFHREDMLPDWAVARGYIADIDGLLFYL